MSAPAENSSAPPLAEKLGHCFSDPALLRLALTHPSWLQEHPEETGTNQRLEFLGDAVIQLILTEALYQRYPDEREGVLSRHRAALSKGHFLAGLARELDLGVHLRLAASEEQTGGRDKPAALEDAFEAVIGAVYVDAGLEPTRAILLRHYGDLADRLARVAPAENPKGRLQERIQPTHGNNALRYDVVHVAGEDHEREYEARVFLHDQELGSGRGSSKKSAEEVAARAALESGRV